MSVVLCTGSWKLRHDEPLLTNDPPCHFHPAPEGLDIDARSIVVDAMGWQSWNDVMENNILPLALMQRQDDEWLPTHLLLRVEPHGFQLVRPQHAISRKSDEPLHAMLRRAFADNHLYLNNFECFYTMEAKGIDYSVEFELEHSPNPERDAACWLRALQEGRAAGFRPAFCDEWRIAHYGVLSASVHDGMIDAAVFLQNDQKRKPTWNSGHGCVLVRCRRSKAWSILERSFAGDVQALLVQRCGATDIVWSPRAACLSAQVCCEARQSGRLFVVCFEWFGTAEPAQSIFSSYRARITYMKTLGLPAEGIPAATDSAQLVSAWQRWAREEQMAHRKPSANIWDSHLSAVARVAKP